LSFAVSAVCSFGAGGAGEVVEYDRLYTTADGHSGMPWLGVLVVFGKILIETKRGQIEVCLGMRYSLVSFVRGLMGVRQDSSQWRR
jgi:hypothetical protein